MKKMKQFPFIALIPAEGGVRGKDRAQRLWQFLGSERPRIKVTKPNEQKGTTGIAIRKDRVAQTLTSVCTVALLTAGQQVSA